MPCAPVKTAREVARDPHLEARGFWVDIDHPRRGRTRVPISPIRLHTGGKSEISSPAPTLGQHTEKVLAELLGLKAAGAGQAARRAGHGAGDGAEGLVPGARALRGAHVNGPRTCQVRMRRIHERTLEAPPLLDEQACATEWRAPGS